jgi:hypothetical protein
VAGSCVSRRRACSTRSPSVRHTTMTYHRRGRALRCASGEEEPCPPPSFVARRRGRPAVARFRADQLWSDTTDLPAVVRRLGATVSRSAAPRSSPPSARPGSDRADDRSLLDILDRTMVADGLWRAGVVRVNHVFRLGSHWSFVPFDQAGPSGPMALSGTDAGQGRHVGVIDTGDDPRHPWMDPEVVKGELGRSSSPGRRSPASTGSNPGRARHVRGRPDPPARPGGDHPRGVARARSSTRCSRAPAAPGPLRAGPRRRRRDRPRR